MDDDLKLATKEWLKGNLVPARIGEEAREALAITAYALWDRLGKPCGRFRDWWGRAKKRQALLEGTDFVSCVKSEAAKKGRGGHNKKDFLVTPKAAIRVAASDPSRQGIAILAALVDVVERIGAGDPELATCSP